MVLVTGATGFIGSHLVDALARRNVRVRALVRRADDAARFERRGIEAVRGSLDDDAALARAVEGVDVVFHLAALTHARSEAELARVNADGTRSLIGAALAARSRPRRFVYLSSLAAVGPATEGRPVQRGDAPRPLTAYGRSKLGGERFCLDAADSLETIVLRAPAVYGPRDRELLRFFRYAKSGILPVPAGPDRRLQMVHARDLADALVRASEAPDPAGIYHVAEPRAYTWREVAGHIARAVGRTARPIRVPVALVRTAAAVSEWSAGLIGRSAMFSRDKARELLAPAWLCETDALLRDVGFRAQISLPDGVAETAAWYRTHGWL